MNEFFRIMLKVLTLISVLIISSCGMQGDLYLPEEKAGDATQETNN
jgi:predicted small lipoprotein YifL